MVRSKPIRTISDETRRDVTDFLAADRFAWWGRLEEPAFLRRVWPDLDELPSNDPRFRTAADDVWQHRVNNPYDWEDDWIFDDSRFGLRDGPDEVFVKFLSETLHPVVRDDEDEVERMRAYMNECLAHDDWELIEVGQRRRRPVFEGRRREALTKPTEAIRLAGYDRLDDPQVVREHLTRIERDLARDPAAAVGASKELVETICKKILDDYGEPYKPAEQLPDLYKKVQKVLRLNVEAVPGDKKGSEAAVGVLRALIQTIQNIGALRNAIGSGHGRSKRSPAVSRHARLAFNAAVTVSEFLLDTWHFRKSQEHAT